MRKQNGGINPKNCLPVCLLLSIHLCLCPAHDKPAPRPKKGGLSLSCRLLESGIHFGNKQVLHTCQRNLLPPSTGANKHFCHTASSAKIPDEIIQNQGWPILFLNHGCGKSSMDHSHDDFVTLKGAIWVSQKVAPTNFADCPNKQSSHSTNPVSPLASAARSTITARIKFITPREMVIRMKKSSGAVLTWLYSMVEPPCLKWAAAW